jgi:hypothetical protein
LRASVKHYMKDVRAGVSLGHATDLIPPKRLLEFLKSLISSRSPSLREYSSPHAASFSQVQS